MSFNPPANNNDTKPQYSIESGDKKPIDSHMNNNYPIYDTKENKNHTGINDEEFDKDRPLIDQNKQARVEGKDYRKRTPMEDNTLNPNSNKNNNDNFKKQEFGDNNKNTSKDEHKSGSTNLGNSDNRKKEEFSSDVKHEGNKITENYHYKLKENVDNFNKDRKEERNDKENERFNENKDFGNKPREGNFNSNSNNSNSKQTTKPQCLIESGDKKPWDNQPNPSNVYDKSIDKNHTGINDEEFDKDRPLIDQNKHERLYGDSQNFKNFNTKDNNVNFNEKENLNRNINHGQSKMTTGDNNNSSERRDNSPSNKNVTKMADKLNKDIKDFQVNNRTNDHNYKDRHLLKNNTGINDEENDKDRPLIDQNKLNRQKDQYYVDEMNNKNVDKMNKDWNLEGNPSNLNNPIPERKHESKHVDSSNRSDNNERNNNEKGEFSYQKEEHIKSSNVPSNDSNSKGNKFESHEKVNLKT